MKRKVIMLLLTVVVATTGITMKVHAENAEATIEKSVEETALADFQYELTEAGEIEITGYSGTDADIVIPDIIDGVKVTSIGIGAFSNNETITSVALPTELEKIGDRAFWRCNALKSIEIPESVTYIGAKAFSGSNFTELNIPANVSYIGALAFGSMYHMESFSVDEDNAYFTICDGVLYDKEKTVLMICPSSKTTIAIPEGVIEIQESAFNDCHALAEIELPQSLEMIGTGAFADCYMLKEITIPANVSAIEGTPFTNCARMTDIFVDEENEVFASEKGILYTKDFLTLMRCPEAKETVSISDKTTKIDKEAFFARRIADKIVVPHNVTIIDNIAFSAAACTDITILNPDCVFSGWYGGDNFNKKVVTLHSYEGSAVQAYAEANEIPYSSIELFNDVPEGEWYYAPVKFAYEKGLMGGKGLTEYGEIEFDPANTITRAEFVRILYNKENKPAVEYSDVFTDVAEGVWYTNAILWAHGKGIVSGKGEGIFDVDGKITRQEIAQILYKYAVYKGFDVTTNAANDLSDFVDDEAVAIWGQKAMNWAVGYNIITGKPAEGGNELAPDGSAIRAEAATMMKKIMMAYETVTE